MADRTERFLARVDELLPAFPDDAARAAFLDSQLDGWAYRYGRFIITGGESEPITELDAPPQAADYLLTIVGLAARRERYRGDRRREN